MISRGEFHRRLAHMHKSLTQRFCHHHWVAALTGRDKPARWCSNCERIEELTKEEFYARFGRMPHL